MGLKPRSRSQVRDELLSAFLGRLSAPEGMPKGIVMPMHKGRKVAGAVRNWDHGMTRRDMLLWLHMADKIFFQVESTVSAEQTFTEVSFNFARKIVTDAARGFQVIAKAAQRSPVKADRIKRIYLKNRVRKSDPYIVLELGVPQTW